MSTFRVEGNTPRPGLTPDSLDGLSPLHHPAPRRILVVDDEKLIADTLVQILDRNGFTASAAYNGVDAVAQARRNTLDLVLSDVMMPEMDGVEAAIAIRQISPQTRIVLFSGQAATVEILARARARGHDFELLSKPIHPRDLLRHLKP